MGDYLLDTNILILALRGHSGALDFLLALEREEKRALISVVTRAEVLTGMHPHEEPRTLELLNALGNLPVDRDVADQAGRWVYQYARQGVQLSLPDALIAATAFLHHLTLVTTNPQHFPIPGLQVQPFVA
mgnify:FL=1